MSLPDTVSHFKLQSTVHFFFLEKTLFSSELLANGDDDKTNLQTSTLYIFDIMETPIYTQNAVRLSRPFSLISKKTIKDSASSLLTSSVCVLPITAQHFVTAEGFLYGFFMPCDNLMRNHATDIIDAVLAR